MKKTIEIDGVVTRALTFVKFEVELEIGDKITAYISGKLQFKGLRIVPGDKVRVEFNSDDLKNGKIVFLYK